MLNDHLPQRVRLPFGYVITIKAVAPSTLKRVAKEEVWGCWDGTTRTIYVDKTANPRKQRYVLTHEMMHAIAEWQHLVLEEDQTNGD